MVPPPLLKDGPKEKYGWWCQKLLKSRIKFHYLMQPTKILFLCCILTAKCPSASSRILPHLNIALLFTPNIESAWQSHTSHLDLVVCLLQNFPLFSSTPPRFISCVRWYYSFIRVHHWWMNLSLISMIKINISAVYPCLLIEENGGHFPSEVPKSNKYLIREPGKNKNSLVFIYLLVY